MRAQQLEIASPNTGMLTAPQRFGGSMNSHVHTHAAAIDGVTTTDEHGARLCADGETRGATG
jgi:hypothetical protein